MSSENIETEGEGNNLLDESMQCDSMLGKQNAALQKEMHKLRDENTKLKEKECSEELLSGKVDV